MAPPWVLLRRIVFFEDVGAAVTGGAATINGSRRELSPQEGMAAMKPNPAIALPPDVTRLSMLLQTPAQDMPGAHAGEISSADKSVVVIYAGFYRPGNGDFNPNGRYLIYDASSGALAVIPRLPESPATRCLGRSAAVSRHGSAVGGYRLAELITARDRGLPDAELCVWSPPSDVVNHVDGQWILTPVRLPLPARLCGPTHFFHIDMAFSFASSYIFWVDLLAGVLVCDLSSSPRFRFVPLPVGQELSVPHKRRHQIKPELFRSMGCVRGAVKFVVMAGYTDDASCPRDDVTLRTWTLSPDFKEWKEEEGEAPALRVGDLWASESFAAMELPRVAPTCPVLSADEDAVVYAVLNDVEYEDDVDEFGDVVGVDLVPKAHYLIRLDLLRNKVLSCTRSEGSFDWLTPTIIASEFSAYVEDPKDHRAVA